MNLSNSLILFCLLAGYAVSASAQVYRCTDDAGQVAFSDQPCEEDTTQQTVEIRPENAGEPSADNRVALPTDATNQLHDAARRADFAAVVTLIERGVNVNATDDLGYTALHRAGHRMGRLDLVQALVEAGADVNAKTVNGYSVLARSIYRLDIAGYLIEQGARVNARDQNGGNSVLHSAVKDPVAADGMIQLLLDSGADVDIRDDRGNTPLHAAVWRADDPLTVIPILLGGGAWVNARNEAGETPLARARELAREAVREDVVRLLVAAGGQ